MSTTPLTNTPVRTEQSPVAQTVQSPPTETPSKKPTHAFRVPNSVIQNLTSNTGKASGLNRLSPFQMVTLLGLLTLVDERCPGNPVTTTCSELLAIAQVSKSVAHTVERSWITGDGSARVEHYKAVRYRPKHLKTINDALVVLYDKSIKLRREERRHPRGGSTVTHKNVHILDMFGFVYKVQGRRLDIEDLPPSRERVNVGTTKRPIWKLRRVRENQGRHARGRGPHIHEEHHGQTGERFRRNDSAVTDTLGSGDDGGSFERPVGVVFRLNSELAEELTGQRGTLCYTLMAKKIFSLLRSHTHSAAMVRLIILVLRQTGVSFTRDLQQVINDLGYDSSHPTRAAADLSRDLATLREGQVIEGFEVNPEANRLAVQPNRSWHRMPLEEGEPQ